MKILTVSDKIRVNIRQDMADMYRKIRKDNPAMARLLAKRQRELIAKLSVMIFSDHHV